jgi:hypothetical protein
VALHFAKQGAKVVGGDIAPANVANDPVETIPCDVTKARIPVHASNADTD